MGSGELSIGELSKKKEELNKTGGINTERSVFQTGEQDTGERDSFMQPAYSYNPRVQQFANNGPLMQTRIHTQNALDVAPEKKVEMKKTAMETEETTTKVKSQEKRDVIKARSDLKAFSDDAMQNGSFTVKAKEAARHFYRQLTDWAGSFEDGGSGFYKSMGISGVMDCLYVDGMSLRNYLKEQYWYKTTGKPAQDEEMIRNYIALIAARGNHVITMARPNLNGSGAEVQYKNLYVDLTEVGSQEAENSRRLKERGDQVRSNLKKRIDRDLTEQTGMAYRKAYGCNSDGFERIEKAGKGLRGAKAEKSEEYINFNKKFENYNGGLQKLGLKPGRDDINLPVAQKMKDRCDEALKAADEFLRMHSDNEEAVRAVKQAKKALETDQKLLQSAIDTKLVEEGARMRLDELLDSGSQKTPEGDGGDNDSGFGDDEGDTGGDE
jgi:hypothetical protein